MWNVLNIFKNVRVMQFETKKKKNTPPQNKITTMTMIGRTIFIRKC